MLVEAETADGVRHSTLLQNAETVRLVCPSGSSRPTPSSSSSSSTSQVEGPRPDGKHEWQAISVSSLQPGQQVFLLLQEGARHTGISIQEQIKEC